MERLDVLAAPSCADLLEIVHSHALAIATLLCIANIDSYSDKSFSELQLRMHAMHVVRRYSYRFGYPIDISYVYSYPVVYRIYNYYLWLRQTSSYVPSYVGKH